MPSLPSLNEPVSDGRIRLRETAERDIPEILIAYQDDPDMHAKLGEARPPSGAQLGSASERADSEREAGVRVALTILEPGSDQCRGQVIVEDVDWDGRAARVRVWVAPQFRANGFAGRAIKLVGPWLQETCGLTLRCEQAER
jgi:RimJ/RimL family protein N-acetyltransferase